MVIDEQDYLAHYGILRRSGRYPWGSGQTQNQRNRTFLDTIEQHKRDGMSEKEISKMYDIPIKRLRALKAVARNEQRAANIAMAERLRAKGMSTTAIGQRMGMPESTVRTLLAPGAKDKADNIISIANALRSKVDEEGMIDIGSGVENHLNISGTKLDTAIEVLREEGYNVHQIPIKGVASGQTIKGLVLTRPEITQKEAWQNQDKIGSVAMRSEDGGRHMYQLHRPLAIDADRVHVRYAEDGGGEADGVIFVRPGVPDLSMRGARYSQVRIKVGDEHYLKGMAIYKDDLPPGVDLQFNTNKHNTGNKLDAMKKVSSDPDNPFGSVVDQVLDRPGHPDAKVISVMNLVNEEGDWATWSRTLSSQFLSKQDRSLVKSQLDLTSARRKEDFDDIQKLTNATVRKKLLDDFANSTDAAAVHLKAAQMPRQGVHVILPVHDIKATEVYAPNYNDGETVVLIRHPHGGTFEIPELTVNNNHPSAKKMLGDTRDAIGIHHTVAKRLSGADFDGDTVLVIPNNHGKIKTSPALEKLKDFDPIAAYPGYEGMKKLSASSKQAKMGEVSNLITDMTIKGAPVDDIAHAVMHSMVIIDAEKHGLNYKQSYLDNGIRSLKEKYQGSARGGASTLISLKKSPEWVDERKPRLHKNGGPVNRKTGELEFEPTNRINWRTGEKAKTRTTKLAETKNAHTLSSGTPIERLYADHSNRLKGMANEARLASLNTKSPQMSASAKKVYAPQVESLNAALDRAVRNSPLERKAQILANGIVKAQFDAHPDMDEDTKKKIRYSAQATARLRVGAQKVRIDITPDQWEAIQAGAISHDKLNKILKYADMSKVRDYATPKTGRLMTPSKIASAKALFDNGYTRAQVAQRFGVSLTTLDEAMKGG
jgi:transposase